MFKNMAGTSIVKVTIRQSIILIGLHVQIVSIHSQYVHKRSLYGSVYDLNDPFLHDVTNDLGLGGDSYLNPSFVDYD